MRSELGLTRIRVWILLIHDALVAKLHGAALKLRVVIDKDEVEKSGCEFSFSCLQLAFGKAS